MSTLIHFSELSKLNAGVQTGDILLFAAILLICLSFGFCACNFLYKKFKNSSSFSGSNIAISKKSMLIFVTTVVIVGSVCLSLIFGSNIAKASTTQNDAISAPEKIEAYLDSDSGEITIENSYVENNADNPIVLGNLVFSACKNIDLNSAIWKINVDDIEVFNGSASDSTIKLTNNVTINPKEKVNVKIATSLDLNTAKTLIDKNIVSFQFITLDKNTVNVKFSSNVENDDSIYVGPYKSVCISLPAFYKLNDKNELSIISKDLNFTETLNNDNIDNLYSVASWKSKDIELYRNIEFPIYENTEFIAECSQLNFNFANVEFVMNGHGHQVVANQAKALSNISKPADPHEEGFYFAGWYKDPEFKEIWDFENDVATTANIRLYARWQINVQFGVNDSNLGHLSKKDGEMLCDVGTPYSIIDDMIVLGDGEAMYWVQAIADNSSFTGWTDSSGQTSSQRSLQNGTTFTANFETVLDDWFVLKRSSLNDTHIKLMLFNEYGFDVEPLDLQYSFDCKTGYNIELKKVDNQVYYDIPVLNDEHPFIYLYNASGNLSRAAYYHWTFVSDQKYAAKGNISCMCNDQEVPGNFMFCRLFDSYDAFGLESMLTECPNINFATASTDSESCFREMFANCNYIITPCEINFEEVCFCSCYRMFYGCKNLRVAPKLPAKTINTSCYESMFENCTSLTGMLSDDGFPVLPAKITSQDCYKAMFAGCTSLVSPINLVSPYLAEHCYDSMYEGCSSLQQVPQFCDWDYYLLNDKFLYLENFCCAHMFEGCTSIVKATNFIYNVYNDPLPDYCYASMFKDCTNLYYPIIMNMYGRAVNYGPHSCESMFENCINFTGISLCDPTNYYEESYMYFDQDNNVIYDKVNSMAYMFKNCQNLLYVSTNFDIPRSKCFVPPSQLTEEQYSQYPTLNWFEGVNTKPGNFRLFTWINCEEWGIDTQDYIGPCMLPEGWTIASIWP